MVSMQAATLSADGTLAVLSKGNNEVEVWQLAKQSPKTMKGKGSVQKLKTLQTSFPVRNGLTLSDDGRFIAAAEGTYREGEGHRTVIEIWNATDGHPMKVFNTGEILGSGTYYFHPMERC